jgi:hypothetical protein
VAGTPVYALIPSMVAKLRKALIARISRLGASLRGSR